jgi:hypothetical protein
MSTCWPLCLQPQTTHPLISTPLLHATPINGKPPDRVPLSSFMKGFWHILLSWLPAVSCRDCVWWVLANVHWG